MSKSAIVIIAMLLLLLVPSDIFERQADAEEDEIQFNHSENEGYVAFIVQDTEAETDDNDDNDDEVAECKCNGTKVMVHGDGHKTPCQCFNTGDGICRCTHNGSTPFPSPQPTPPPPEPVDPEVKPDTQEKKVQGIYFGATWCGPCISFNANEVPKLREAGYIVSSSEDADIRKLDVDEHPNLWNKYSNLTGNNVIPQFIIEVDGVAKRFWTGYTEAEGIIETLEEFK